MTDDKKLHFHFDFLSPFGYLASLRIDDLTLKYQWECEWHPMLLGVTVLKIMGLPPIAELPLKGPYIRKDAERSQYRFRQSPWFPADKPTIAGACSLLVKTWRPFFGSPACKRSLSRPLDVRSGYIADRGINVYFR